MSAQTNSFLKKISKFIHAANIARPEALARLAVVLFVYQHTALQINWSIGDDFICFNGKRVISDSVLLTFLFWNPEHRRDLPLYLFHLVRSSRWGWMGGFVSRSLD